MKKVFVPFLTLLAILLFTMDLVQGFSCNNDAKKELFPCLGYLIGEGNVPSSLCCEGIFGLKSSTPTKDDRHAACECFKR
ncbi:putative plant lipid transfer protein/Par allergen [Lupinus albus]|uniref:Putative plant lipid transfer protein/Par allergen n=1 Tax=Lupinus albus TaxID=3870 RepID=A0A6A4QME5_LUPAL|nr:putative plant lipid transfer protein/Par allergen [Lupinus albus]